MTVSPLLDAFIEGASNHTSGPNGTVTRVVIHATVSACVAGGARGNAAYFQDANSGGLAHVVVDPGEIIGCCDEDTACWHAPPNQGSIGVELCDPQGETGIEPNAADLNRWNDGRHQSMLAKAAAVVADICTRHGIPKVRIGADELVGGRWGICGHGDVSAAWHQTDHQDPDVAGPFPWDQFMALVNGGQLPQEEDVPRPTDWIRHIPIDGGHFMHLRADGAIALSPGAKLPNYMVVAHTGEIYAFGPGRSGGVPDYAHLPDSVKNIPRTFYDAWLA